MTYLQRSGRIIKTRRKKKTWFDTMLALQEQVEREHPGAKWIFTVAYDEGRIDYTNVPDEDRRKKFLGRKKAAASPAASPPGVGGVGG